MVPGNKAIKIKANSNRRSANVVVANLFRRYRSYSISNIEDFVEGICFFTTSWERIVNYPKLHSANCTAKHQATQGWFKPTVRILKNLRSHLVEDGLLDGGVGMSYFLEGLLYNVPKEKFGGSYSSTMAEAINWIFQADRSKFVTANEQYPLLGTSSAVQWSAASCDRFLDAVKQRWNSW